MPFDSLSEAMASPAETADKIAFAAGYVSTWLVAVVIVWGVPYYGYKKVSSRAKVLEVTNSVSSILEARTPISTEDEESFDFDVSGLPEEFQALLNAKRPEHLELWKKYGIGERIEKQAHFTQVVISTDAMVPWDPEATLERLKPFYWLIWMRDEADLALGLPSHAPLGDSPDEDETEEGWKYVYPPIWSEEYLEVLKAYGLSDFWKPIVQ